jgi:MFS family permease
MPAISKAPRSLLALIALAVGEFLVGLDLESMSVALPSIQREFGVGMMQLQWAVMAYMVAGAAVAVPFGAVGDKIGRRRLYLIGTATFAVGSAVSALAPSMAFLILGRTVQGVGGGAMGTLALAMLVASVPHDGIPKMIGLWTAITAGSSAVGPLIGGALVTAAGWRWVFGINVILISLVIPLVLREVTRDTPSVDDARRVDVVGTGLITASLILIAGGLSLLENFRLSDPQVYVPLILGLLVVAVMSWQQRHAKVPLTDWKALRIAPIPATLILLVILSMVLAGALLQVSMVVQNVLGFTPLLAGAVTFGSSAMLVVLSPVSPKVMGRIGLGPTAGLGLLLAAAGLVGMSSMNAESGAWFVGGCYTVMGAGFALAMPAVSAGAMSAVPQSLVGAVSGFMSLIGMVAAVLGIAVLGALSAFQVAKAWVSTSSDIANASALTSKVVSGAIPDLRTSYGDSTANVAARAYLVGVTDAMRIASVGVALAGIISIPLLGNRGRKADGHAVMPVAVDTV